MTVIRIVRVVDDMTPCEWQPCESCSEARVMFVHVPATPDREKKPDVILYMCTSHVLRLMAEAKAHRVAAAS